MSRLYARAGLGHEDALVIASERRVVAGPKELAGEVDLSSERAGFVTLAGRRYRAVGTPIFSGRADATLVALTPKAGIDAAVDDLRRRFLLFAFVALAVVALLAYALGRTIVSSLKTLADAAGAVTRGQFERRVQVRGHELASLGQAFNDMAAQLEAERGRVQGAVDRFGKALAATHDPSALLTVIVESTVEATGAAGGRLIVDGREVAHAGTFDEGKASLAIPIGRTGAENTMLLLAPSGGVFSDRSRALAFWLASQAAVALENVRLHRLLERQATTDGLTELPNRRQFEQTLANEINRAQRFGDTLALVLADLDDFKQVNDRHGHQAGDDVLRAFARVLPDTVRDFDLPTRYGGEEFAVLLPRTDLAGAEQVAERLRQALATRPLATRPAAFITVTASFGVAAFPDASTPAALFAAADEALYPCQGSREELRSLRGLGRDGRRRQLASFHSFFHSGGVVL